jgi:dipeptidyl-peptidase-3
MRKILFLVIIISSIIACKPENGIEKTTEKTTVSTSSDNDFQWVVDKFSDKKILKYQIPDFDKLSAKQKGLVYYLTEAGLAGRDIMYDQNYRHNLEIRKAIENIIKMYTGDDQASDDYKKFMTYAKEVWFANGIHHHYSMDKFIPEFHQDYFYELLRKSGTQLSHEAMSAIFEEDVDNKKVNLDESKGLLKGSAINMYHPNVSQAEAKAFYAEKAKNDDDQPVWHGLNSYLSKDKDGNLYEEVYSLNGRYGSAIAKIIENLEQAVKYAENNAQGEALELLIEYYKTGDLGTWDDYNVAWVEATEGDIDYINGFIEVYNDPIGYKGSYESIVEIKDFEASKRMAKLSDYAQWFEDNSTILPAHKKKNVVGISYKVVNVAGESGDASPSTPIGVNLPNANWIRKEHGSKSVSLGNIIYAYAQSSGPGMLGEFAHDKKEIELTEKYGGLASKMATALHEVIGHASGKINEGVGTPKQTLQSYASAIEEARADIVALYFIMDPKIVELGLIPSQDVAIAEYDMFISNGLMKQLQRIKPGKDIEESHMRNRQTIAAWAYEKGAADNVIEKVTKDGKTYFNITDYQKLRTIFGELLTELQRMTSEGDYDAAKNLIENYGVKVDQELHAEVLERVKKLNIAPYGGFVNPILTPSMDDDGVITDVKVSYPKDFTDQMMTYGEKYSFLEVK